MTYFIRRFYFGFFVHAGIFLLWIALNNFLFKFGFFRMRKKM